MSEKPEKTPEDWEDILRQLDEIDFDAFDEYDKLHARMAKQVDIVRLRLCPERSIGNANNFKLMVDCHVEDLLDDILHAIEHLNDGRPETYTPLEEKLTLSSRYYYVYEEEVDDDDDDYEDDPEDPYVIEENLVVAIREEITKAIKTIVADYFPDDVQSLHSDGYRYIDNTLFRNGSDIAYIFLNAEKVTNWPVINKEEEKKEEEAKKAGEGEEEKKQQ